MGNLDLMIAAHAPATHAALVTTIKYSAGSNSWRLRTGRGLGDITEAVP